MCELYCSCLPKSNEITYICCASPQLINFRMNDTYQVLHQAEESTRSDSKQHVKLKEWLARRGLDARSTLPFLSVARAREAITTNQSSDMQVARRPRSPARTHPDQPLSLAH